ncbi:Flagellar M-ring protein [Buchnera aphidicola (Cinara cuneomaculata)]|uniref:Flagellar M-ring protein n=1 Tax=Buchnera aphidicola (Cinara cuneomaculata) TaxID=1660040 RepID=A0A451CXG7_9GAMM|nr:flagellar basal-body MS-ring/collar protein FliF [Buchnera aphidicola]VFP78027.1 Flagellar M-ring protein [Buchnera aphidicola (Cinara cuneomaculata)]
MDVINNVLLKIKKKWHTFLMYVSHRLKFIIFIFSIIFFFISAIFFWFNKINYVVLYDNLSDTDGQWITSQLKDMNISYRFRNSYKTLLVPSDKVHELHFSLINNQDIKKKTDGFKLLDKEKFGISQFHENINYHRGLEGELSKTLEHIFPIKYARVHLVCKKDSDFFRDKQIPSASVIITLFPNTQLNSEQIDAITLLLAGSVPDLSADRIVVVNQFGNVLNKFTLNQSKFFKFNKYKKINTLEEYYSSCINKILFPIYGSKNIIAHVTADVNFNHINSRQSNLDYIQKNSSLKKLPDNISDLISCKNQHNSLNNSVSQLILELLSMKFLYKFYIKNFLMNNSFYNDNVLNKKFVYSNNFIIPSNSNTTNKIKKKIIDFNSVSANNIVSFPGFKKSDIRHLTITVLINYKQNDIGIFTPLSTNELQDIEKLVKSVIDFSDSRGDCINIINCMFSTSQIPLNQNNALINMNFNFNYLLVILLGILIIIFIIFLFVQEITVSKNQKKYLKPLSNNNLNLENRSDQKLNQLNLNINRTVTKDDIFNKNPKIIEQIIRYWMNKK